MPYQLKCTTGLRISTIICSIVMFGGCADDDPSETATMMPSATTPTAGETPNTGGDSGAGGMAMMTDDANPIGGDAGDVGGSTSSSGTNMIGKTPSTGGQPMGAGRPSPMACMASETDYPGDTWNACISDDGTYHKINDSVSSIARIASFETIADTLWRRATPPTGEDFTNARIEYAIMEGLDSRVRRRYDSHVAKPDDGSSCRDATEAVLETYPDYCVGPAQIVPLLNRAFVDGTAGLDPWSNAARIEAGLLWFLYVSTYKEANSCAAKKKDCDSNWAYYTGGFQKNDGTGLSGYVRALEPRTHGRVFDGILAVRCWRDGDTEEPSTDAVTHEKALLQLDRALDRALVVILIDRLNQWNGAEGDEKAAHWAFLEVLGPVADRLIRARDTESANTLKAAWTTDGSGVDSQDLIATLNATVPCP